ncbi:MAG: penicillin-binding protein activator [Deltaproteobacteria bacterium]|nr:penicillin-binding protein activator [Deltaproteobacteria bacterium]
MFRLIYIAILLLCNAAFVRAQEARPFKVGIILALSGEGMFFGQSLKNGMLLAYESLSKEDQQAMQLIFEDDSMVSRNTITAFNKLRSVDDIDAVVTMTSGTSNALAPLAERQKIPMIAIASDKTVCANRNYVMNHWATPEVEAEVAVQEAERRNYKKIIALTTLHDGGLAVKNSFKIAAKNKIELVIEEDIAYDNRDIRSIIAKIKTKKDVDAIMLALLPGQLAVLAKQLRQYGVSLPLFGFEMFEDKEEVKASDGALINQWYVNASDATGEYTKKYISRYGDNATRIASNNGFDIIMIINDALKKERSRQFVNRYFHTLKDYRGASGVYSATDDNRFSLPAAVKLVTDKEFIQLRQ